MGLIKGNKEFIEWWEHWMSRIHSKPPFAETLDRVRANHGKDCEQLPESTPRDRFLQKDAAR